MILVAKNPNALCPVCGVRDAAELAFSTRFKIGQTFQVLMVAVAGPASTVHCTSTFGPRPW
jgi:predicted secreted protein